jgi:hypothetical protein
LYIVDCTPHTYTSQRPKGSLKNQEIKDIASVVVDTLKSYKTNMI